MFLRITPFLPNWFINIAAPHTGIAVQIKTFFWSTVIGGIPANFIAVEIGNLAREMETNIDTPCYRQIGLIVIISFLLSFTVLMRKSFGEHNSQSFNFEV